LLAADYLHYLFIAVLAHVINVIQAYVMQRRLVFRSEAQIINEFLRFNASLVATFLFNLLAMYVLVETTSLSPLIAQAIVILASLILTYVLHSRVSFRRVSDRQGRPR
jgi:putative flippase GtrA